jgi:hypothetical protein
MSNPINLLAERFQPTSDFTLDFRSDKLRTLHQYWQSKLAGRPMPRRPDIEPTEIPALLQHIALIGVDGEPPRLFFRLIGTHITDSLGRDNTGRYFDEAYEGQLLEDIVRVYGVVLQSRAPVRHFGKALFSDKKYRDYESVHLPLSQDGVTVNMIVVGQEYFF